MKTVHWLVSVMTLMNLRVQCQKVSRDSMWTQQLSWTTPYYLRDITFSRPLISGLSSPRKRRHVVRLLNTNVSKENATTTTFRATYIVLWPISTEVLVSYLHNIFIVRTILLYVNKDVISPHFTDMRQHNAPTDALPALWCRTSVGEV